MMVASKAAIPMVLLVCLVACTTVTETPSVDMSVMSDDQQAALADGMVSHDEYQAGFTRFQACLSSLGFEILVDGETNSTILYSVPDAAVQSGADAGCYDLEFRHIDGMWQVDHEDTSHSAEDLRDCLVAHEISPQETLQEMAQQLEDAGIDTADC